MLQKENVTYKTRRRRSTRSDRRRNHENDQQGTHAQETSFGMMYNNERAGTSVLFSSTFYDNESSSSDAFLSSTSMDYDIMPDIQESSVDDSVKLPILTAKALEKCYPENHQRFNPMLSTEPRKILSASRVDSEVMSLVGLQYVASCAASTEQHYQAHEQDLSGFQHGVYKDEEQNEKDERDCFISCCIS